MPTSRCDCVELSSEKEECCEFKIFFERESIWVQKEREVVKRETETEKEKERERMRDRGGEKRESETCKGK
jgi:hypothetical protein